jgi:hypothetical protein
MSRIEVEESLIIEDFITADMSGYYLWTLNSRRQMSHCTLARRGPATKIKNREG